MIPVLAAGTALGAAMGGEDRRAAMQHEAERLLALPYSAFEHAAAARSERFDWSTDGCSHTPRALARRFASPCRQHDC